MSNFFKQSRQFFGDYLDDDRHSVHSFVSSVSSFSGKGSSSRSSLKVSALKFVKKTLHILLNARITELGSFLVWCSLHNRQFFCLRYYLQMFSLFLGFPRCVLSHTPSPLPQVPEARTPSKYYFVFRVP